MRYINLHLHYIYIYIKPEVDDSHIKSKFLTSSLTDTTPGFRCAAVSVLVARKQVTYHEIKKSRNRCKFRCLFCHERPIYT